MGKNILTPNQKRLLAAVSSNPEIISRFYLTSGTALAEFYLKHRFSQDLDFFSERFFDEKIIVREVGKIAYQLEADEVEQQKLRGQNIFFFHFSNDVVKLDFAYFPFEHLRKFKRYNKLNISSLLDIAVNKLQGIISRSRARDYYDLYEIFQNKKYSVEKLRKNYRLKFDISLHPQEIAKCFTAVLDASDQPRFLGDISWKKVEDFFLRKAKTIIAS